MEQEQLEKELERIKLTINMDNKSAWKYPDKFNVDNIISVNNDDNSSLCSKCRLEEAPNHKAYEEIAVYIKFKS